jgi:hypothetical protein
VNREILVALKVGELVFNPHLQQKLNGECIRVEVFTLFKFVI